MPKVVTFSGFFPSLRSSSAVWADASPHQDHNSAAHIFFMITPFERAIVCLAQKRWCGVPGPPLIGCKIGAEPAMPSPSQQIRFCTSADGVRIAYATSGNGPPLVKVGTWMTHVELDWESSVWRPWLRELSRDHTFLRYDARGCGLSDREVADISLEA